MILRWSHRPSQNLQRIEGDERQQRSKEEEGKRENPRTRRGARDVSAWGSHLSTWLSCVRILYNVASKSWERTTEYLRRLAAKGDYWLERGEKGEEREREGRRRERERLMSEVRPERAATAPGLAILGRAGASRPQTTATSTSATTRRITADEAKAQVCKAAPLAASSRRLKNKISRQAGRKGRRILGPPGTWP